MKAPQRLELVIPVSGRMDKTKFPQGQLFIRGEPRSIEVGNVNLAIAIFTGELLAITGLTFLINSPGGDVGKWIALEHIARHFSQNPVQAIAVDAGSAASVLWTSVPHRSTHEKARFFFHAPASEDPNAVPLYLRCFTEFLDTAPATAQTLVSRLVHEVTKTSALPDHPVTITGAELAALGKTDLYLDVPALKTAFEEFLPEAKDHHALVPIWTSQR